jgi:WW domain-containing oxidoreductase
MEDLKQYDDTSRVSWQHCNLRSLQQTDQVAKKLRTEEYWIDGVRLLRFATLSKSLTASSPSSMPGIGVNKFALTELDNLDSHFEINLLSQLHLDLILLPTLKSTAGTTGRPSQEVLMSS